MGWMGTLGSILGGGAGFLLGGPAGALTGAGVGGQIGGGLDSNSAQALQAEKNRDFQQKMSDTAHQREVRDLRLAGLNPILSATHGGASTPSGAVAPQSNIMEGFAASAIQLMRTMSETNKMAAETKLLEAQTDNESQRFMNLLQDVSTGKALERKYLEESDTQSVQRQLMTAQRQYNEMLTDLVEKQKITETNKQKLQSQDLIVAKAAAKKALTENEIDSTTFGKIMRYIDRIGTILHGANTISRFAH